MDFSINPSSGLPIYQQLADAIRQRIARGQLVADTRLPSVRELSQSLVVNPNTIARAYTELEREGVLYSRPGLGVFVANAPRALPKKIRRERLTKSLDTLLVEAIGMGAELEEVLELLRERAKRFQWPTSAAAAG